MQIQVDKGLSYKGLRGELALMLMMTVIVILIVLLSNA